MIPLIIFIDETHVFEFWRTTPNGPNGPNLNALLVEVKFV